MEAEQNQIAKRKKNGELKKGSWPYMTAVTLVISLILSLPRAIGRDFVSAVLIFFSFFVCLMGFNLIFYLLYGSKIRHKTRRLIYLTYFIFVAAVAIGFVQMELEGYSLALFLKSFSLVFIFSSPIILGVYILNFFDKS